MPKTETEFYDLRDRISLERQKLVLEARDQERRVYFETKPWDSTFQQTVLEVGTEGGSLSIVRQRNERGAWEYWSLRDETTMLDILEKDILEKDELDDSFVLFEQSAHVGKFKDALLRLDKYPWFRFVPLKVNAEFATIVLREVERRGGKEAAVEWTERLKRHHFDNRVLPHIRQYMAPVAILEEEKLDWRPTNMPHFTRYIGIDYSGAETADSSCKGIRVFMAEGSGEPTQVQPPPSPRRYWTRRGLAEWLREELDRDIPTLVGIDHAFSFPLAYFEKYRLPSDWEGFLEDFHHYWPTDAQHTYVCFIREDPHGRGEWRTGERSWLRVTETWTASAKSVFGFGVQGEVATSTHAGLPWLLYLRKQCKRPVQFWPFDGWAIPEGKSVVAEVYPSLWTRRFPRDDRDGDEQAAYAAASWLQRADRSGSLGGFLNPSLTPEERGIAKIEGWILGVV